MLFSKTVGRDNAWGSDMVLTYFSRIVLIHRFPSVSDASELSFTHDTCSPIRYISFEQYLRTLFHPNLPYYISLVCLLPSILSILASHRSIQFCTFGTTSYFTPKRSLSILFILFHTFFFYNIRFINYSSNN